MCAQISDTSSTRIDQLVLENGVLTKLRSAARVGGGEVFTRRWVVEVILDLVGYTADRDLVALGLMEPACGVGAFLVPAVERLAASAVAFGHVLDERAFRAIQAFEVQSRHVEQCRASVTAVLRRFGVCGVAASELVRRWVRHEDYLLSAQADSDLISEGVKPEFDVVVGNPPYVRFDGIGDETRALYRSRWPTMSGRADMYVGFYERALRSLKVDGRLGFICADRWMRNQYGAALRKFVTRDYSVDAVWSMHDVNAFETPVAAYPAITVLSRRDQGEVVVAETSGDFAEGSAKDLARWTLQQVGAAVEGDGYSAFRLPRWFSGDEMWPVGSPTRMSLIKHLGANFAPLHDLSAGTRVGIGVTTGADKVYVLDESDSEFDTIESDRLLRLAMAFDTRSGSFRWGKKYLVNPWDRDGDLVDLAKYPGLSAYLNNHRSQLDERHAARAKPRHWYRTVDKVNFDMLSREKLLIQDMQSSLNPVLESGGCYPHHNLYYVVSTQWDMQVLGGLLLSQVAQAFIEAYSVRMRGNTLRFQAQYLKKIRVPDYAKLNSYTKQALKEAFLARDVHAATTAALGAYGLSACDLA